MPPAHGGMTVQYTNENGISSIIEGTWRNASTVLNEARRAKAMGRITHAVLVAVPPTLSRLGILSRFYFDMANGHEARWTPPKAHENTVVALMENVPLIASSGLFHRFTVLNRSGSELYDGFNPSAFVESWSREFRRALDATEKQSIQRTLLQLILLHERFTPEETEAADMMLKIKYAAFGYPNATPSSLPYLTSMDELKDWADRQ
ncbi:hypothetical protein GFD17_06100 [Bifidobacterium sp. SMB2]|uniref:UDP-N-acetylglucosamine kinase n=2 Tax=Bifidobacterium saimiriisciurei TaxID=2661627 RepID=A0ABX0C8X9_9BIFI|nr:hypothetical protein [Bifidobacterium sp. SMB2]NEH11040.1 hypothetical protein [Bifidobacterium saimiriisciurei]